MPTLSENDEDQMTDKIKALEDALNKMKYGQVMNSQDALAILEAARAQLEAMKETMGQEDLETEITEFWYKQPAGFPTSSIGGVTASVAYILANYALVKK